MVRSDGGLGQMVCSCGSFLTICQWSCTDLENCLPFDEYGVTTGKKVRNLMPSGFVEKSITRVEERSGEVASGDF